MADAAQVLIGKHDFTTFRSVHCQAQSPVKTLDRLDVTRNGDLIELGAVKIQFWIAKAEQIRLRWREWLTWLALILLTAAQVALIYWLPQ